MISKTGSKGFTLVEVVVAVAILSIGVVGILRAYIVSMDAIGDSQEYIAAVSLAKEKMNELLRKEKENEGLSLGSNSGHFEGDFRNYKWVTQIASSSLEGLSTIKVTVSNSEINLPKEFSLAGYVRNQKTTKF